MQIKKLEIKRRLKIGMGYIMFLCLLCGCNYWDLIPDDTYEESTDTTGYEAKDNSVTVPVFEDYALVDYAVICEIMRNELVQDGYDVSYIIGCELIDADADGDLELCVNVMNGEYGYTFYVIDNYEQPSISITSITGSTLYEYFVSESQQKIVSTWGDLEYQGYNIWEGNAWQNGTYYIETKEELQLRDLYFNYYDIATMSIEADKEKLLAGLEEHFSYLGSSVQKGYTDVDGDGVEEIVYQVYDYMESWLEAINNIESMGEEVFATRNSTNDDIYFVVDNYSDNLFNVYASCEVIEVTAEETVELSDGSTEETNKIEEFVQDTLLTSSFYNPSLFDASYQEYIFDEDGIVTINNIMYDQYGVTELIGTNTCEYVVDEVARTVTFQGNTFYYIEKYGCFRASDEYNLDQDYRGEAEYYEDTHLSCLIPMGENPDVQEMLARFEEANGF